MCVVCVCVGDMMGWIVPFYILPEYYILRCWCTQLLERIRDTLVFYPQGNVSGTKPIVRVGVLSFSHFGTHPVFFLLEYTSFYITLFFRRWPLYRIVRVHIDVYPPRYPPPFHYGCIGLFFQMFYMETLCVWRIYRFLPLDTHHRC